MKIHVTAYFEDGNRISTPFNGSFLDAKNYYLGKYFSFPVFSENFEEKNIKCVKVSAFDYENTDNCCVFVVEGSAGESAIAESLEGIFSDFHIKTVKIHDLLEDQMRPISGILYLDNYIFLEM